ncbi:MarR family winged helix-turn-helix transcriptional regulator [Alkalicoccus chagannorensis]|uniref:MarR family winged helix-turn-helix transcriptional regulator n=1 Tax=Alkalicoccus chagannorensis TaxID=427072 RepID=UPI00040B045F|nr:MarR family transcriptional regulator [Alkalicoccus chagannorensis]
MDDQKLKQFIDQYATVYLAAVKKLERKLVDEALPVSLEQFGILRVLYNKEKAAAKDIAEEVDVHKSAVSTKLNRLEKEGLIRRSLDEKDRRSRAVVLTEKGKDVFHQCEQATASFIEPIIQDLTEEEWHTFLRVYEKLSRRLSEGDEE